MKKHSFRSPIFLFLTAFIWGTAFVAQSVGMDYVGPFTFNAVRSTIGAMVLIPCIWFLNHLNRREGRNGNQTADSRNNQLHEVQTGNRSDSRILIVGGICCGTALFAASNLQQFGIQYTTVGKAGFITALYIVLVPVFGIFLGKKTGIRTWIGVVLAVVGLYLLCITEQFTVGKGDLFVLLCASIFAVHILIIDYFSPKTDGLRLSCIQFLVCGILSGICMLLFEKTEPRAILNAWIPICYAGVMSCGVAYTLQIIGQKDMDPTIASLILSLESVVAVLAGWVLLGQQLSTRELCGCVIMFCAIILAQLPGRENAEE